MECKKSNKMLKSEALNAGEHEEKYMTLSHLPYHVLTKICRYYAESSGLAATYMCLAKISKTWKAAALNNKLWSKVNEEFSKDLFQELLENGVLANTKQLYFPTWMEHVLFRERQLMLEKCPKLLEFCSFPTMIIPIQCGPLFSHMQGMEIRYTDDFEWHLMEYYFYCHADGVPFTLSSSKWTEQLSELILHRIEGDLKRAVESLGSNFFNLKKFKINDYATVNEAILNNKNHLKRFPLKSFQAAFPLLEEFSLCSIPVRLEDEMPGFMHLKKFSYEPYSGDDNERFIFSCLFKAETLETLVLHRVTLPSLILLNLPCNNLRELSFSFCSVVPQKQLYNVLCKWKSSLKSITMFCKSSANEELIRFIEIYGKSSLVHLKTDAIDENKLKKLIKECVKLRNCKIVNPS